MNDHTTRPSVHSLIAQQEERERYEIERARADGVIPMQPDSGTMQRAVAPSRPAAREVVTATKLREALVALLARTNQAAEHAAAIAASLDGGPANGVVPPHVVPTDERKRPLFTQFAKQIVDISTAIDLVEAQLKRIDGVLA